MATLERVQQQRNTPTTELQFTGLSLEEQGRQRHPETVWLGAAGGLSAAGCPLTKAPLIL